MLCFATLASPAGWRSAAAPPPGASAVHGRRLLRGVWPALMCALWAQLQLRPSQSGCVQLGTAAALHFSVCMKSDLSTFFSGIRLTGLASRACLPALLSVYLHHLPDFVVCPPGRVLMHESNIVISVRSAEARQGAASSGPRPKHTGASPGESQSGQSQTDSTPERDRIHAEGPKGDERY